MTTTDSDAAAADIARHLVEARLAACVQVVGPIQSHYWWEEAVQCDAEWQCVIKTRADLYDAVEAAIRQVHTYEVPEILATRIEAGGADYLAWLQEQTRATG